MTGRMRPERPLARATGALVRCDLCGELVTAADPDGRANVRPMVAHRACAVRSALGGIGHLTDHALWCGERNDPDGGMSYRASALAVLRWAEANGAPS